MRALRAALVWSAVPLLLPAQQRADSSVWNDSATLRLVDRAIARRTAQLADTGLVDYTARAHGYVTFLAQVGEGFPDPPRVMKSDELAVEVYWRAPDRSKQRIIGRRDTLLLPTDIEYHRDHLAIVQNNFPAIIRLGEGDEVRDVPHPLSPTGRTAYDFAIGDSLTIRTNDRDINVLMVRVRPKDERLARAVGAVYLDRGSATIVRMAFSFTRAALLDKYLEDVSVVLENGLVDGRFWLPYRQEIEIRRTGSWFDFPSRGIIRGRWDICCVQTNVRIPLALTAGPELSSAPPAQLRAYPFTGSVLAGLPEDVTLAANDDVRAVQDAAREMVRAQALARVGSVNLSARSISDLVRVNRVEGLALGFGVRRALGAGFTASGRVRYGTSNRSAAGAAALSWNRADGLNASLYARRDFAEAGDAPEVSGVRNSLAAQEFGADYTDPYLERVVGMAAGCAPPDGWRWSLSAERRQEAALAVHAVPSTGRYEPTIQAAALQSWRAGLDVRRAVRFVHGATLSARTSLFAERERLDDGVHRGENGWIGRGAMTLDASLPMGRGTLVTRTFGGALVGGAPAPEQRLLRLGGPAGGAGFDFHQFAGRAAFSQKLEWQHAVPFIPLRLGRFGKVPSALTLAPFVSGMWVDAMGRPGQGWHGSIGVGILSFFDQLRIDVARGVRQGRWSFGVDLASALWPIL